MTPQEFFTGKSGRGDFVKVGSGWAGWVMGPDGTIEYGHEGIDEPTLSETLAMLKQQAESAHKTS